MQRHDTERGPIPIVIGIAGHRDLRPEDTAALRDSVRRVLVEFRDAHPHTPMLLLSALAEGADRLCAREALDSGFGLVAVLPMPRELYEQDFVAEGSHAEFDELLARAMARVELQLQPGTAIDTAARRGEARDRQYELAGHYVARHSQILLALWDGDHGGLVGGTSSVVRAQLNGDHGSFSAGDDPLDPPDGRPVVHVLTPRSRHPAPPGAPFSVTRILPPSFAGAPERGERLFAAIHERIDRFNRDAMLARKTSASELETSALRLFPAPAENALAARLRRVRDTFAIADVLAMGYQRRTTQAMVALFATIFLAAVMFDGYAHLVRQPWIFVVYLLLVLVARAIWKWARSRDYQNRHQDYRTLAEGLRVAFFWGLAGVDDDVAANYLRKQRGELNWIRSALRNAALPADGADAAESVRRPGEADLELTLRHWVQDQADYFRRAATAAERRRRRLELASRGAISLGVAASLLLGISLLSEQQVVPLAPRLPPAASSLLHGMFVALEPWIERLVVVIALASVLSALLHNLAEKQALREHVKQFERMNLLFDIGAARLVEHLRACNSPRARSILHDLGREALAENGDWILLHRERPLEIPEEGMRYSSVLAGLE